MNVYIPPSPNGACYIDYDLAGFIASTKPSTLEEGGIKEDLYNSGAVIVDATVTISDQGGSYFGGGMFWRPDDPDWDIDGGGHDIPQLDAIWVLQKVKLEDYADNAKIFLAGRSAASDLAGFVSASADFADSGSAIPQSQESTTIRGLHVETTQSHFKAFGMLTSLGIDDDRHHRHEADTTQPAIDGDNAILTHIAESSWGKRLVDTAVRSKNATIPVYQLAGQTVPGVGIIGAVDYTIDATTLIPNMQGTTTSGITKIHDAWHHVVLTKQLRELSAWHTTHSRLASQVDWTVSGITPDVIVQGGSTYNADFLAWFYQVLAEEEAAATFNLRMEWANGWNVDRSGLATDQRNGLVQRRQTQTAYAVGSGKPNTRSWDLRWNNASVTEALTLVNLYETSHAGVRAINFAPPEDPSNFIRVRFVRGSLKVIHKNAVTASMSCVLEEVV